MVFVDPEPMAFEQIHIGSGAIMGAGETAGERRSGKRFSISLELRWKLFRRRRLLDTGAGTTIDLSSDGVLFESDHAPPTTYGTMELAIAWPARLQDAPLQLIVVGHVVRIAGRLVAVRKKQHEFRTAKVGR